MMQHPFLTKINNILDTHLSDEKFGLQALCSELNLSRPQVFRKMKAINGIAPSDYIRIYRLEKARDLLLTNDITVAQAAYQVGFKDPSYFSKVFLKHFGLLPSELKRQ